MLNEFTVCMWYPAIRLFLWHNEIIRNPNSEQLSLSNQRNVLWPNRYLDLCHDIAAQKIYVATSMQKLFKQENLQKNLNWSWIRMFKVWLYIYIIRALLFGKLYELKDGPPSGDFVSQENRFEAHVQTFTHIESTSFSKPTDKRDVVYF